MRLSVEGAALREAPELDVVVVGSGYGAGVLAARLAAPPSRLRIAVLERGRELDEAELPTTGRAVRGQAQVHRGGRRTGDPQALFDVRLDDELTVLVGCGLGGTSLINASVALEPAARVFAPGAVPGRRWPAGYDLAALAPYYARARAVLKPAPTPELLGKARFFAEAARRCGYGWAPTDVTVDFAAAARPDVRPACTRCGNCVTGCVVGAKRTVRHTYLPLARRHGALLFTGCAVRWIEPAPGGYRVHYDELAPGGAAIARQVRARLVVLGAGALGSTEILLRSRAHGLSVSDQLGTRFSGNGDSMALGYGYGDRVDSIGQAPRGAPRASVGPTISGIVDLRSDAGPLEDSLIIEEGAFPAALSSLLRYVVQVAAVAGADDPARRRVRAVVASWWRELKDLLGVDPVDGNLNHTQLYFAIGHDGSRGTLTLAGDGVRIDWPKIGDLPAYRRGEAVMSALARAGGGLHVHNPLWRAGKTSHMVTAHPLGGCALADTAADGAVDPDGRVFTADGAVHPGLYVVDGAVIPTSLGVNPLLTITAVAERIADRARAHLDLPPAPA